MYATDNHQRLILDKTFHLHYINSCSDGPLEKGYFFGPISEHADLLQYVTSGCGTMTIDGKAYFLKAGDAVLIYAGQARIEHADANDPWAFCWVTLSGTSIESFSESAGFSRSNPVVRDCRDTRIPLLFQELALLGNSYVHHGQMFKAASKIFELFDEFSHLYQKRNNLLKPKYTQRDYVEQAMYYIDSRYQQKSFSVDSLAKLIGLNRSYLYKIFKAEFGLSPQEYLTKLRVSRACEYLLLPQATVTSVAASVGYDPLIFSRTFKRIMGINPSEYRKNNIE